MHRHLSLISIFFVLVLSASALGQVGADGKRMFPGAQEEPQPIGLRESLEKMRIEKEKKEYGEMLARSEEVLKLVGEIQRSYSRSGALVDDDRAKVAKVEKLVKKIRDGLGGDGDDGRDDEESIPVSTAGAVEALKERSEALSEQLKQTSRFSISASAIYTSNSLLKITRFLKARQ